MDVESYSGPMPSYNRPLRLVDLLETGAGHRYVLVTEAKHPWIIEGLFAVRRRLPDGMVLSRHGPFASPGDVQRFLVAHLSEADRKAWMVGDVEFEDGE